jgi:2-pyrone-4,6-dicarboxylate lactonase
MADVASPGFHPASSRPRLRLPAGACDAHCHVFGPARVFPFAPERRFTPDDAPKERLFALHALLGIERCVIVQSGCHGFDNRVVADAITAKKGHYCGIALVPLSVTDAELRTLHGQGFRGARFSYMKHLVASAPIADVITFTHRLADLGWQLHLHFDPALIDEFAPWLARSATPLVIDHMARIDASCGVDQPAFRALCALMEHDHIWVKVSGVDRCSRQGPPYADAIPMARALVESFGDRVLWGTDWPHPNHTHVPDDGQLVDFLAQIAPSEAARHALLVDNPQRLYRFPVALAATSSEAKA